MKRFALPVLTILAACLLVLSPLQAKGEGKPFHLRLAYSPSLCQAPLHVAVEKGFFAAEGIEAENIQIDPAHVQEAVAAGQIDAGFGLIGKFLKPLENGLPIKFTAGIHTGCIKLAVAKDSPIRSVADLKGKRIGVTGLVGAETIIAKRALAAEGISVDAKKPEVEFVVFSRNDLGQAIQKGIVDAVGLGDPAISLIARQYGLRILLDTAKTGDFAREYCCGSFVSIKFAKENPAKADAFTRAVLKASVWVQQHPEEAARIQLEKKYVAGTLDFNTELLKSYNYIPSVQGGYDALLKGVTQLVDIGMLDPIKRENIKAFVDNHYLFSRDVPDSYKPEDIASFK